MNWGKFAFRGRQTASRSAKTGGALRALLLAMAALATIGAGARVGQAETLSGALVKAYVTNPVINSQRATVRQTDEGVPTANAGYLPKISAFGNDAVAHIAGTEVFPGQPPLNYATGAFPRGYGAQLQETLFDGYQTINRIRSAESQVLGAREQLRNTEQNTLLTGVTAYMDVLRDTALLELQRNNVLVLQEQLRETRDRFTVGEVTRTDVAQAEASLSSAQSTELSAEATLEASIARYRQTIGDEPKMLAPAKPIVRPLPKTLPEAISISQVEHPAIVAQLHGVDAALLSVKIAEGALAPSVGLTASVSKNYDLNNIPGNRAAVGEIMGQVTIPIYQGGAEYASIRQSKESLSVQELTADSTRDQIRQNVVSAWGLNQAAVGVVRAARAAVAANEVALAGVREEAKVGQRTTLDVLNAQQALLQARSQLVSAEHDAVVDSYSLLSAVGRLNVPTLGLAVSEYDPRVHFNQVKSKWFGVTTPEGK
ncbi:MAG TPA: TolC family outer membrane protein [Roseiarcus sp.]|nr:TolC family outer membrane protein [Roseiarcus sp.]